MKYPVIFCLAFLGAGPVFSQVSTEAEEMRKRFPNEEFVVLHKSNILRIELKAGALQVMEDYEEEILYLSNNAPSYASKSVDYNSFDKISKLEAYTLVPINESFKKKKVTEFTDKDELNSGIFVDDSKSRNFSYPSLENGCHSVMKLQTTYTEPRFQSTYYLRHSYPVIDEKLVVIVDNNVSVNLKEFNFNDNITKEVEKLPTQTIYRFSNQSSDVYPREGGTPSGSFYLPHVVPIINSFTYNGKETKVLSSVQDLYSWYVTLIKRIENTDAAPLKSLVDSITINAQTQRDKAEIIFSWVQKNVKYIALEDGLGGFIPRSAPSVCSKRFGDCKDMAHLLVDMMTIAGIEAHHTWIGTRDRPYSYLDVPSPITDNHMITMVRLDGVNYFLDATDKEITFGFPSGHIQGKEALVGIDDSKYEIITIPIIGPDINYYSYRGKLSIVDKKLKGNATLTLNGYLKHMHQRSYSDLDATDERKRYKGYLELGNNKFNLIDYTVNNQNNKELPTTVDFNFEIQDYITTYKDELYVNIGLERGLIRTKIEDDREFPIEYNHEYSMFVDFELAIPDGYSLIKTPANLSIDKDKFTFSVNYTTGKNTVTISQKYVFKTLMIEKPDFLIWNEFSKAINQSMNESIILKKI